MAATGERMLELLSLLQVRYRWSGQELADRLEVSPRTLRRDIDRLRDLGYPVHAERGVDGGYRLGTGSKLPPLLLTDDEAVAVAIGLSTAADQRVEGIAEASTRALIKVGQYLTPPLQRRVETITSAVDASPMATVDTVELATLTTLARASRDREQARFDYRGSGGERSVRQVEPHHVVPLQQRWYLVAWDLDRDGWRTFRLDRVADPRSIKRRFEPRRLPTTDAATYVREKIAALQSIHHVELVVKVSIESVRPHLGPWGSATELASDRTRILMDIPDLGWAVLMLAVLDADVVSAEPAELRGLLRDLAGRFLAVTDPVAGPSS